MNVRVSRFFQGEDHRSPPIVKRVCGLNTAHVLGQVILCGELLCACMVVSSIPGLCPLDASSPSQGGNLKCLQTLPKLPPLRVTIKDTKRIMSLPPGFCSVPEEGGLLWDMPWKDCSGGTVCWAVLTKCHREEPFTQKYTLCPGATAWDRCVAGAGSSWWL